MADDQMSNLNRRVQRVLEVLMVLFGLWLIESLTDIKIITTPLQVVQRCFHRLAELIPMFLRYPAAYPLDFTIFVFVVTIWVALMGYFCGKFTVWWQARQENDEELGLEDEVVTEEEVRTLHQSIELAGFFMDKPPNYSDVFGR